jgi:uncharacterized membrane protein YecN with MAPEG domain
VAFVSRTRHFSKAFLDKHFPDANLIAGGYPDSGCGLFAHKLSVADWVDLNNHQRAHLNFLESVASVITMLLVSGLYFPRFSFTVALVNTVARVAYAYGYITGGARGRLVGALTADAVMFVLLVASVWGPISAGGGFAGLVAFYAGSK